MILGHDSIDSNVCVHAPTRCQVDRVEFTTGLTSHIHLIIHRMIRSNNAPVDLHQHLQTDYMT